MTLLLALLLAATQPAPAPVLSAQGEVTDASPKGEYEIAYGAHRLRLAGGTRYRVIVRAPQRGGFPSRIEIRRDGGAEPITRSRNIAPVLSEGDPIPDNALDFVAPASGDYELRVLALGPEPRGRYAVRVLALPPVPVPQAVPPVATQRDSWRVWTGALGAGDPDGPNGIYHDFPLEMQAGETWIARVEREGPSPGQYFGLRMDIRSPDNPDGGALLEAWSGLDDAPTLAFRPPRSGIYLVRVSGLNIGSGVRYRLSVTRLPDQLAPSAPTP